MIEYVDAQKWYMTFCLNAAPISSRVRFFLHCFCENHEKINYLPTFNSFRTPLSGPGTTFLYLFSEPFPKLIRSFKKYFLKNVFEKN